MNNIAKIAIVLTLMILIFFSLSLNTQNYVPANQMNVFTNNHPYNSESEGFNNKEGEATTNYSTFPENKSTDSYSKWDIAPDSKECYKINGIGGLVCSPENIPCNPKEIYSDAKGSLDCESYGLMNSKGFLCLDENQKKLYTTRGGNATGGIDIGLYNK